MHDGHLPHFILPEFLDRKPAASLLDWVLAHEAAFSPSQIDYGDHGGMFRRSLTAALDKPFREMFKTGIEQLLPKILQALGMPAFEHRYEIEAVAYNDGAYLRRHVDVRPDRGKDGLQSRVDRRLSAVYYFYRAPKSFSGGELRLYPLFPGAPIDLEPQQNLLVVFPAFAPHEVMPVNCPSGKFEDSRFTVNVWLHHT